MAEEQKRKWPEVVDKDVEEAKAIILGDNPNLRVEVLKKGSPMTRDYYADRVRIVVNDEGKVVQAPFCG